MRFVPLEQFRDPQDGEDWAPAWQRAMASDVAQVSLPAGVLKFHSGIDFGKNVEAVGCGRTRTSLWFIGTEYGVRFVEDDARLSRCHLRYDARFGTVQTADGIRVEANRPHVVDVWVTHFPRDGVHVSADVTRQPPTNANHGLWELLGVGANGRDGVHFAGGDSQCHLLAACSSGDNDRDGFHDASFLGNSGFGLHASANKGASYVAEGDSQRGVWQGYAENGQGPARVHRSNLSLNMRTVPSGQAPSARVDAVAGAVAVSGGEFGAGNARSRIGVGDPDTALSISTMSGGSDGYSLVARQTGGLSNLWAWAWKGAGSLAALALTTAQHARGAGLAVLPRGALVGMATTQRLITTSAQMPTGGVAGDIALAADPTPTLDGWRCLPDGQGVKWRPFVWSSAP